MSSLSSPPPSTTSTSITLPQSTSTSTTSSSSSTSRPRQSLKSHQSTTITLREQLKSRCLQRAREQRKSRISANRSTAHAHTSDNVDYDDNGESQARSMKELLDFEVMRSVRTMEAKKKRNLQTREFGEDFMDEMTDEEVRMTKRHVKRTENDDDDDDDDGYYSDTGSISDSEIYDFEQLLSSEYTTLLNEIETELRLEEETLLKQYDNSIADEHLRSLSNEDDDSVLCPICNSTNIVIKNSLILCKKKNCLRIDLINDNITLSHVKSNLQAAIEDHYESCGRVSGMGLTFDVLEEYGLGMLVGKCEVCCACSVIL